MRGSQPRMPLLVMTAMAPDMARPRVQANLLGAADTHSGRWRRVSRPASAPTGLYLNPAVTRMRKSSANRAETACSGQYTCRK